VIAVGRKNYYYLFAGSDRGGERHVLSDRDGQVNSLDPEAYLRDVLGRIADDPINRIAELLPWHWRSAEPAAAAA
jgi:transposase